MPRVIPVFGVDVDQEQVILVDGTIFSVDAWYDPMSQQCTKERACAAVFAGPGGQWYAVDLRSMHVPDKGEPVH